MRLSDKNSSDKSASDKQDTADVVSVAPTVHDREEERLAALGYKQEFAREFTNLSVRLVPPSEPRRAVD